MYFTIIMAGVQELLGVTFHTLFIFQSAGAERKGEAGWTEGGK